MEFTSAQRKSILDLARRAIHQSLAGVESQFPATKVGDDGFLLAPAGCFVSLHRRGSRELRGCVGRLDATEPLHVAVEASAVAVLDDPRFSTNPVRLDELPELELEVSVVSPLHEVRDPLDFDRLNDGIYLTCGSRSGCFLPQVARETGWSKEQLLERLCTEKMGLPPEAWRRPDARMSVFSTSTVGPEPFMTPDSINPGVSGDVYS